MITSIVILSVVVFLLAVLLFLVMAKLQSLDDFVCKEVVVKHNEMVDSCNDIFSKLKRAIKESNQE